MPVKFRQGILPAASSAKQVESLQCLSVMALSAIIKGPLDCRQKHTEQAGNDYARNLSFVPTYNEWKGDLNLTHCSHHLKPSVLSF